jgi:hypothetical protein
MMKTVSVFALSLTGNPPGWHSQIPAACAGCGVGKWVVVDERSVRRLRRSDGRKGGCGWNGDVVEVTSGCVVRARGVEIERG